MESFIAAHLGEREVEEEMGGDTATADPFKYISFFPPYTITSASILLLYCLSSSTLNPSPLTAHTRSHTKPCMHACVHTHTHPDNHPALFFSRPDPLYVFDGPIHVVCDVVDSPLPSCPAFKPSSSSGCLSPGVDCIFYLSFSFPWLYLPQLKKKILGRKLQSA